MVGIDEGNYNKHHEYKEVEKEEYIEGDGEHSRGCRRLNLIFLILGIGFLNYLWFTFQMFVSKYRNLSSSWCSLNHADLKQIGLIDCLNCIHLFGRSRS